MHITTKVEHLEKSRTQITGELAWEDFQTFRAAAIKKLANTIDVDGFRKGTVPEAVIVQRIGDMGVLEEMSQLAIMEIYPKMLIDNKIDAIGYPDIKITKIASGSALGFTITTSIMPVLTLPDYKKIAKKIMDAEADTSVSEKEIAEALVQLRKMRYQHALAQKTEDKGSVPDLKDINEADIPELSDEDVQQFGNFKTISEFVEKLKENLSHEKLHQALDKKRAEIIETIIKEATIEAPAILIEYELDRMIAQVKHDISMNGMSFEDYLKHTNKTLEDIRKDYTPDAEKRAYMQLIINKIATEEKIEADKAEVEKELEHIRKTYKDHKDFDENRALTYVESVLLNQAVFEFLESQGKDPVHTHGKEKQVQVKGAYGLLFCFINICYTFPYYCN